MDVLFCIFSEWGSYGSHRNLSSKPPVPKQRSDVYKLAKRLEELIGHMFRDVLDTIANSLDPNNIKFDENGMWDVTKVCMINIPAYLYVYVHAHIRGERDSQTHAHTHSTIQCLILDIIRCVCYKREFCNLMFLLREIKLEMNSVLVTLSTIINK